MSPESKPQNQESALIERRKGELVIPQIEQSDLEALRLAREQLQPLVSNTITQKVKEIDGGFHKCEMERGEEEGFMVQGLRAIEEEIRTVEEIGLLWKKPHYYIDREGIKKGYELAWALRKERLKLSPLATLGRLKETAISALAAAERTGSEIQFYLRYCFPTPVTKAEMEEFWQAIIPQEDFTSVLGGLLYERRRSVPFKTSGERFQHIESEEMKLMPPLLPAEMLVERGENIVTSAAKMGQYLHEVERLVAFLDLPADKKKSDKELEAEDRLRFAVRVFNHALAELVNCPGEARGGIWAIYLYTALSKIEKQMRGVVKGVKRGKKDYAWHSLVKRIEKTLKPPSYGLDDYLRREGYRAKGKRSWDRPEAFFKPVESS